MYIYKPPFCFRGNTDNPSPLASKYQGKARKQHAFKGVLFTAYYIEYLIEPCAHHVLRCTDTECAQKYIAENEVVNISIFQAVKF